jgi:hypothetical protein
MMRLLDPAGAGAIGYEGFKALMATHFNVVAASAASPTRSAGATPQLPPSPGTQPQPTLVQQRYFA